MSDQPTNGTAPDGGAKPAAATPPAPAILIRFAEPGSAELTVELAHVSPGQVYAAAWFLDAMAHELRAGDLARQQAAALTIPGASDLLGRLGQKYPR